MTIYLVLNSTGYPVEAFDTLEAASNEAMLRPGCRVLRMYVNLSH